MPRLQEIFGGNAVSDEYGIGRHVANLFVTQTYEGQSDIHCESDALRLRSRINTDRIQPSFSAAQSRVSKLSVDCFNYCGLLHVSYHVVNLSSSNKSSINVYHKNILESVEFDAPLYAPMCRCRACERVGIGTCAGEDMAVKQRLTTACRCSDGAASGGWRARQALTNILVKVS
jgi:hypothetical protein